MEEVKLVQEQYDAYANILRLISDPKTFAGVSIFWQNYVDQYGTTYDPNGIKNVIEKKMSSQAIKAFSLPLLEWVDIPEWKSPPKNVTSAIYKFRIGKYPVTNSQFQAFVDAKDGYSNSEWWLHATSWFKKNQKPLKPHFEGEKRPREMVNWYEAVAFANWLSFRTGLKISLPTRKERLRVVQGDDGRPYPWGRRFDPAATNTREKMLKVTTSVDKHLFGATPLGVLDLSGNVWEWGHPEYDISRAIDISELQFMYGGGFRARRRQATADFSREKAPDYRALDVGFRLCVVD